MINAKALHDTIIFTFEDAISNGTFMDKTASGLYLGFVREETVKAARPGRVHAVGPLVKEVKVGDRILIEALMWSDSYNLDGKKYWNTSEAKVIGVYDGE